MSLHVLGLAQKPVRSKRSTWRLPCISFLVLSLSLSAVPSEAVNRDETAHRQTSFLFMTCYFLIRDYFILPQVEPSIYITMCQGPAARVCSLQAQSLDIRILRASHIKCKVTPKSDRERYRLTGPSSAKCLILLSTAI